MATTDIIQYCESGSDADVMSRRSVQTFIASAAIAARDAVAYDFSQSVDGDKALYVLKSDTGTATSKCFAGVSLDTAAAGEKVRVVVRGIAEANVDGSTAAGSILQVGSTAGRLDIRTVAINEGGSATFNLFDIAAHATEADTANVATVFVVARL
jgi:hypothetical protein